MPEFLETTVDKFTFKVATDRFYTHEGEWALPSPLTPLPEGEGKQRVRIGLSDFLQQRSGDIAFAEVKPVGTVLSIGDEVASIETIKVNVALGAPVNGTLIEINPAMETAPEAINQDPYGEGWLATIEATDWEADRAQLLDPQAYFVVMKAEAEEEAKKL
ncbi:MAG: glycine cleavage system protein H [Chloroflexi bacterium]|nr:glycine cleavage system protein H [Chloroflexota bacterium]